MRTAPLPEHPFCPAACVLLMQKRWNQKRGTPAFTTTAQPPSTQCGGPGSALSGSHCPCQRDLNWPAEAGMDATKQSEQAHGARALEVACAHPSIDQAGFQCWPASWSLFRDTYPPHGRRLETNHAYVHLPKQDMRRGTASLGWETGGGRDEETAVGCKLQATT